MSSYLGIIGLLNPKFAARLHEQELASRRRSCEAGGLVLWPDLRAKPSAYQCCVVQSPSFFDAEDHLRGRLKKPIDLGFSHDGMKMQLRYRTVEKGDTARLHANNERSWMYFDRDVQVPQLAFASDIMMSVTPMECLSQRQGISRTKGHTVVGGLGLGWSLLKILERPKVEQVTVIEIEEEVLKAVKDLLGPLPKKVNWIHGNLFEEAPKIEADFLFADIWMNHTWVGSSRDKLIETCPKIGGVWCWGYGGSRKL
jgi:hypothetical protein